MMETECWGTLIWEKRESIPKKHAKWRLPKYPNALERGGVVYRLRFRADNKWRTYIGYGGKTVRERLGEHLKDSRPNAAPQRMMQECLKTGSIEVWTLSRESTIDLFDETVEANGVDKFNLLLFEAAAVVYAVRKLPKGELLNRPDSLPYGTHKKVVQPKVPRWA